MLQQFKMPARKEVEQALLRVLFQRGGAITEFGSGEEIVNEMADEFGLTLDQRKAVLQTTYRAENRVKNSLLWHRLLFRAADVLANADMVSRPTQTVRLTKRKEWMLTEKGLDAAMRLSNISPARKESLPVKSFEVQKVVKSLVESTKPPDYDPVDRNKRVTQVTTESALRGRGFRQAVTEAYDLKCAVCGLKIWSPDYLSWEVQAAHIVPNRLLGRDDIWNGIAFCHLHHWAFDVGWFTLSEDFRIELSPQIGNFPASFGKVQNYDFIRALADESTKMFLPTPAEFRPDYRALRWHRDNIFSKSTNIKNITGTPCQR